MVNLRTIISFTLAICSVVTAAKNGTAHSSVAGSMQDDTLHSSVTRDVQAGEPYSFLVAGHAYGAHEGGNTGLHPAFLQSLDEGFDSLAAFIVLTGDIVNQSTADSWQQVEDELSGYALPGYYVMGNHDNNDIGRQVFDNKFGGTYYAFLFRGDQFIVLNSTEQDRSISPGQMVFLREQIMQAGDSVVRVFIFFHEILWNSHEKYTGVMANNRSRYDEMVDHSNYWGEVHPLLEECPEKQFFVIAGDVGGRPDAVAAFYDRWDNVTLIASGMGEVPDENYLLVRVDHRDSVAFELVPLRPEITLEEIEYYSVPPSPDSILGPDEIMPGSSGTEFNAAEVFNATGYLWELPPGLYGASTTGRITVDADSDFAGGTISVRAEREGFGRGPAASKMVRAFSAPAGISGSSVKSPQFMIRQGEEFIVIGTNSAVSGPFTVRVFDSHGRLLSAENIDASGNIYELKVGKMELPEGLLFISVSGRTCQCAGIVINLTR